MCARFFSPSDWVGKMRVRKCVWNTNCDHKIIKCLKRKQNDAIIYEKKTMLRAFSPIEIGANRWAILQMTNELFHSWFARKSFGFFLYLSARPLLIHDFNFMRIWTRYISHTLTVAVCCRFCYWFQRNRHGRNKSRLCDDKFGIPPMTKYFHTNHYTRINRNKHMAWNSERMVFHEKPKKFRILLIFSSAYSHTYYVHNPIKVWFFLFTHTHLDSNRHII